MVTNYKLYKIFILPGFRHTLSTFIHYAPTALTQKIISAVSSLSDEARYITANKIKYLNFLIFVIWVRFFLLIHSLLLLVLTFTHLLTLLTIHNHLYSFFKITMNIIQYQIINRRKIIPTYPPSWNKTQIKLVFGVSWEEIKISTTIYS